MILRNSIQRGLLMRSYPLINLHIHSNLSFDSELQPDWIVQESIKLGFQYISITDHLDLNPNDPAYGGYDYEKSKELVERLRREYPEINILFGVEIGFESYREKEIGEYLSDKEFDFCIGSIHIMENMMISKWSEMIDREGLWEKIALYYEQELALVRSGLFNVIGHFDYYKKYMDNQERAKAIWRAHEKLIGEIFRTALKNNMVLEINTAGFRRKPKEQYPSLSLLRYYVEMGGKEVTIGSDAHKKDQLTVGIDEAYRIVKELGLNIRVPLNVRKK